MHFSFLVWLEYVVNHLVLGFTRNFEKRKKQWWFSHGKPWTTYNLDSYKREVFNYGELNEALFVDNFFHQTPNVLSNLFRNQIVNIIMHDN